MVIFQNGSNFGPAVIDNQQIFVPRGNFFYQNSDQLKSNNNFMRNQNQNLMMPSYGQQKNSQAYRQHRSVILNFKSGISDLSWSFFLFFHFKGEPALQTNFTLD
jgi:hypothetical protein